MVSSLSLRIFINCRLLHDLRIGMLAKLSGQAVCYLQTRNQFVSNQTLVCMLYVAGNSLLIDQVESHCDLQFDYPPIHYDYCSTVNDGCVKHDSKPAEAIAKRHYSSPSKPTTNNGKGSSAVRQFACSFSIRMPQHLQLKERMETPRHRSTSTIRILPLRRGKLQYHLLECLQ